MSVCLCLQRGHGTLDFIDELYDTAGKCLKCGLRSCEVVEDENFGDFADSALTVHKGQLKVPSRTLPFQIWIWLWWITNMVRSLSSVRHLGDLLRVRGATAVASTLLVVAMPTSLRPTTTRKTMAPSIGIFFMGIDGMHLKHIMRMHSCSCL